MNNILIFVLLGITLYWNCTQSTNSTLCKLVMFGAIWFVLYTIFAQSETFSVEITPWKKTCLDDDPSECCCPRGFNGQDTYFEYTSDADRLKCSAMTNRNTTAQQMMARQMNRVEHFSSGSGCGCSG